MMRRVLPLTIYLAAALLGGSASAVVIVDMDFNGTTGLENAGVGPDGVLVGTTTIGAAAGVGGTGGLVTDGADDSGLRLDIGELGAFSGSGDFHLSFDFKANTPDAESGQLFSADPTTFLDDEGLEFPGGQEAAFSVGFFGEEIGFDLWFFGGGGIAGPFNDGNFHTVNIDYDATEKVFTLSSPSSEEVAEEFLDEEEFPFALGGRDTTNDLTWLGNNTNLDLIEDETGLPCDCTFDNLLIEGPSPPPVKLVVDRLTGDIDLEVIAGDPTTIDSIRIESDAGTLVATNYTGLGAAGGDFADWSVNVGDTFEISEGGSAATVTSANGPFDLGAGIWNAFFDEDLQVFVNDTALGGEVRGVTEFVNGAPQIFGDLNQDDTVDIADFALFRDGFGADVDGLSFYDAYFLGDLTGDGDHNFEDWIAFREAFDEFNGEGAFAAIAGVPEPGAVCLALLGVALLLPVGRRVVRRSAPTTLLALAAMLAGVDASRAEVEVLYQFDTDFSDSSGNGRTGIPVGFFSTPSVSGGDMVLSGDVEEGLEIPLPADLLAGGSSYTVQMDFNTSGNTFFPDAGALLFSSANSADPANGDNQSMSIFIEPQFEILDENEQPTGEFEGGALVLDYYFIGEVRIDEALLLDGQDHSLIATYQAPADLGTEEDPNPGTVFLNLDGQWLGIGELAPRPAAVHDLVQAGTSANSDFPFECFEGECFVTEFEGTMDNIQVSTGADVVVPTLLRAEVDRATGDVTLLGGEFEREINYYEINSENGALNPSNWASLSNQNLDPVDDGIDLGETWTELNDASDQLAEGHLLGSSIFNDTTNASVSLGNIYNSLVGGEDLEIIAVTAEGEDIAVQVQYINDPVLLGDFDDSGAVDGIDLAQWEGDYGLNGDSDANGDGQSTGIDFVAWQQNFGATAASGAAANPIPEPAALMLFALAAVGSQIIQRKRPMIEA